MKNILFNRFSRNWIAASSRTSLVLLLNFVLIGCDSFTDVGMPVSELNYNAVFEQKNTAYAAMTDVYAKMREDGVLTGTSSGISRELGLYADELAWYGSSTSTSNNFYNNTVLPSFGTVSNWWNYSYSQIYSANAVIQGVAFSQSLLQVDKDQLTGEAKFVRGLLHFYMLQIYGPIPYVTTTDYKVNSKLVRMSEEVVYELIIADLESASELLSDEISADRFRPNSFTAKALLARLYLYQGSYAEASNSASAVLNNSDNYYLPQDLNDVFLKASTSTIWQFAPRTSTRNSDHAQTFIINSAPPSNAAFTNLFMASFEPGDQRKEKWIASKSGSSGTYFYPFKYKKLPNTAPQEEYTILMRLQELYLIRAEARARQGELSNAKEDLDVIRQAAGLGLSNAVTKEELIEAVFLERRSELFTEYGHRFMDLKRAGTIDAVLSIKPAWQSTDRLLPVPQKELNLNPNLGSQNNGY